MEISKKIYFCFLYCISSVQFALEFYPYLRGREFLLILKHDLSRLTHLNKYIKIVLHQEIPK